METYFAPTIIRMLDAAFAAGTKTPKIRLQTSAGQDILIYRAGPRAGGGKFEGSGSITDGRPFGESIFFGRVDRDGQIRQPRKDGAEAVAQAIVAFDRNPQTGAGSYGAASGNCCFCAQELTDPRSNPNEGGVGYGPTCAKNFGLPWGEGIRFEGHPDQQAPINEEPACPCGCINGCGNGDKDLTFDEIEGRRMREATDKVWAEKGIGEDLSACEASFGEAPAPADDLTKRPTTAIAEGEARDHADEAERIVNTVIGCLDGLMLGGVDDAIKAVKEILDARL